MPAMPASETMTMQRVMDVEVNTPSSLDHCSIAATSDIDAMAENVNKAKENQQPSRADVKAKLKESDRKWARFLQESQSELEEHLSQVSSGHSQYLLRMTGLHQNLHQNIKDLARLKSDLRKFVCPSALESFESSIEKLASPHSEGNSSLPQPESGPVTPIQKRSGRVQNGHATDSPCAKVLEEDVVTEAALKEHLFNALTPLYGLKDTLSSAMIPMYEEIRKMNSTINGNGLSDEMLPFYGTYTSTDPPANTLEQNATSTQHSPRGYNFHTSPMDVALMNSLLRKPAGTHSVSKSSKGSSVASRAVDRTASAGGMSRSVCPKTRETTMHRAHSHLNFAVNLVGGHMDESMDLMSVMHEYKLPSKRKLLVNWFGYEPDRTSMLARVLTSQLFERLILAVIMVNMVHITMASDYAVLHPDQQSTTIFKTSEVIFQIFYFVELILKLIVHRLYYFIDHDWKWNWLDFILVSTSSYDLYMTLTAQNWDGHEPNKSEFNLTFLRVLRLARISKVIRIFRVVRFVSELHMLVRMLMSTVQPMFWCTCILIVFFYLFAIIFVNATATYLVSEVDSEKRKAVIKVFGSVPKAMVTLYETTTGGRDWGGVLDILADVGNVYYCLFLFFIGFIILALLNILTGIFVEGAMKASAADKDGQAYHRLMQECATVIDLAKLHCVMSGQEVEENGTISLEDFEYHMSSPAVWARFSVMGLEIWDSEEFFLQLSALADSEKVDMKTFVAGCLQMRGTAQRLSLQSVASQVDFVAEVMECMSASRNRRPSRAAMMVSPAMLGESPRPVSNDISV